MQPRRHRRPRQFAILILLLAASGYLAAHAVYGRHGLASRSVLLPRIQVLQGEIMRQETMRTRLLRDVGLLAETTPDPDLVGEIARSMLGFAAPDEIVVQLQSPAR